MPVTQELIPYRNGFLRSQTAARHRDVSPEPVAGPCRRIARVGSCAPIHIEVPSSG